MLAMWLMSGAAWCGESVGGRAPITVAADLTDGSHVVGIPAATNVGLRTVVGIIDVPFAEITSMTLRGDESAVVDLANGDRLSGAYGFGILQLDTLVGRVSIEARSIRTIKRVPVIVGESAAAGELKKDLILYYPFEDDRGGVVRDRSGAGHDGRVQTVITVVSDDSALTVDGVSRILQQGGPSVSHDIVLSDGKAGMCCDLTGGHRFLTVEGVDLARRSFTLCLWAKLNTLGRDNFFFFQGSESQDCRLHAAIFKESNEPGIDFWGDPLHSPNARADTDWHFWAFTYSTTDRNRRIYRDGILVGEDTSHGDYAGSGTLYIGRGTPDNPVVMDGRIDEVMVFKRCLKEPEVRALSIDPTLAARALGVPAR